jgi:hypothetical protein
VVTRYGAPTRNPAVANTVDTDSVPGSGIGEAVGRGVGTLVGLTVGCVVGVGADEGVWSGVAVTWAVEVVIGC